jgi:hypothetical protein
VVMGDDFAQCRKGVVLYVHCLDSGDVAWPGIRPETGCRHVQVSALQKVMGDGNLISCDGLLEPRILVLQRQASEASALAEQLERIP